MEAASFTQRAPYSQLPKQVDHDHYSVMGARWIHNISRRNAHDSRRRQRAHYLQPYRPSRRWYRAGRSSVSANESKHTKVSTVKYVETEDKHELPAHNSPLLRLLLIMRLFREAGNDRPRILSPPILLLVSEKSEKDAGQGG